MDFLEQYKHPKWQEKRAEVFQANGFACSECGSTERQLHVHHPYYKKGARVWEYECRELLCLCYECHGVYHHVTDKLKEMLAPFDLRLLCQVLGYASAMVDREKKDTGDYDNPLARIYEQGVAHFKASLKAEV